MTSADVIAAQLQAVFQRIERTAMAGMPILNPALSVAVVGMRAFEGEWLAVLVTPWFMNIVLLPREGAGPAAIPGTKEHVAFPAGRFEFICAHADELGAFRMCSLFSPMFEFADQEAATATARHVLEELLVAADADTEDADMLRIWEGHLPADALVAAHPDADTAAPSPNAGAEAEEQVALSRRALFGLADAKAAP